MKMKPIKAENPLQSRLLKNNRIKIIIVYIYETKKNSPVMNTMNTNNPNKRFMIVNKVVN